MTDLLNALRDYLEAEVGCTDNTVDAYLEDARQFLAFAGNRQFSPVLGDQWMIHLEKEGLKASSRARKRIALMTLYRVFARKNKVDEAFLRSIDPVRRTRHNLPVLTPEQIDELVAGIAGPCAIRNAAIVRLMFSTGIRVSECLSLIENDIREDRDSFRIMAKGRCERVVPISADCRAAVLDYARRWRTRYALTSPFLFIGTDGERLARRAVSGMLSYHTSRLSMPHATAHTLRRSCATSLMNGGQDVDQVQKRLGHRTISATQQYLYLSHQRLKDIHRKFHPSCQTEGQ